MEKVVHSEAEWRARLTPEQYRVVREKGAEPAYSGAYWSTKAAGVYACVACGQELFSSRHKFDSGTGWPSFWAALAEERLELREDKSFFLTRTEACCARCGGHVGHVFPDGPSPSGLHYCLNSVALQFIPAPEAI